jgi:hypothetical protein
LQEKAEASYHEAETHESQAGANPCKKCSLRGQIVPLFGLMPHLHRSVHSLSLCGFAAHHARQVTDGLPIRFIGERYCSTVPELARELHVLRTYR